MDLKMIRKANAGDRDDCVDLIYMAMPEILEFVFAGKERQVKRVLKYLFTKLGKKFSAECFWVDESENGAIRGAIGVHPGQMAEQLVEGIKRNSFGILLRLGPVRAFKAMRNSSRIEKVSPKAGSGAYHVDILAVSPNHRGQRIGASLMDWAAKLCREAGFEQISLFVVSDNSTAIRFYEKCGYKIIETYDRKALQRHRIADVHIMTKDVRLEP